MRGKFREPWHRAQESSHWKHWNVTLRSPLVYVGPAAILNISNGRLVRWIFESIRFESILTTKCNDLIYTWQTRNGSTNVFDADGYKHTVRLSDVRRGEVRGSRVGLIVDDLSITRGRRGTLSFDRSLSLITSRIGALPPNSSLIEAAKALVVWRPANKVSSSLVKNNWLVRYSTTYTYDLQVELEERPIRGKEQLPS
jgi:hypothetical protein